MAAVDIGRLRLRGPPHLAAHAAFQIEDACRTAIPDSERLILVRRLDLGRSKRRRSDQSAALQRAYEAATQGARHGGDDSSADANCVWFASRAEARRLLLALLFAGRRPAAWYWRLAVPGWRGQPLETWLGEQITAALAGAEEPDLLEIVSRANEAGAIETLLRVLAGPAGATARGGAPPGAEATIPASPARAPSGSAGEGPDTDGADPRRAILRLRARLPPALATSVETVVRRIGPGHRASASLIERLLLVASPSLALAPALLRDLVRAYGDQIAVPAAHPPRGAADRPFARRGDKGGPADEAAAAARTQSTEPPATPPATVTPPVAPAAQAAPAQAPADAHPLESPLLRALEEIESQAAGLWLAIPALIRMGFREWLAARPEALCEDPGRTLLRAIACHHRVLPDDPALAPLGPADEEFQPPDWARLWRVGLDRWLRRRARVPLARLVWRTGWIRLGDDRLIVRFPPGAADIRLRRRALDVDPGWTDWLGLSVRYAFAERPLP